MIRDLNSDQTIDYATVQEAMGGICLAAGDIRQATTHFKKALAIYEAVYNGEPDMIETKKQEILQTYTQAGLALGQQLKKKKKTKRIKACTVKSENFSDPSGFLFFYIYDQFSNLTVQITAQFTDQICIYPLEFISAIPVKIRSWNIQITADRILADSLFFQQFFYAHFQMTIIHLPHLNTKYI